MPSSICSPRTHFLSQRKQAEVHAFSRADQLVGADQRQGPVGCVLLQSAPEQCRRPPRCTLKTARHQALCTSRLQAGAAAAHLHEKNAPLGMMHFSACKQGPHAAGAGAWLTAFEADCTHGQPSSTSTY